MSLPAPRRGDHGAADPCPRCDRYLAEIPVRRSDTGEVRRLCRACARLLVESTPGLEAPALYGRGKYGEGQLGEPNVTIEELHKECYLRKYADGERFIDHRAVAEAFDLDLDTARGSLRTQAGRVDWLEGPLARRNYTFRIKL